MGCGLWQVSLSAEGAGAVLGFRDTVAHPSKGSSMARDEVSGHVIAGPPPPLFYSLKMSKALSRPLARLSPVK